MIGQRFNTLMQRGEAVKAERPCDVALEVDLFTDRFDRNYFEIRTCHFQRQGRKPGSGTDIEKTARMTEKGQEGSYNFV